MKDAFQYNVTLRNLKMLAKFLSKACEFADEDYINFLNPDEKEEFSAAQTIYSPTKIIF